MPPPRAVPPTIPPPHQCEPPKETPPACPPRSVARFWVRTLPRNWYSPASSKAVVRQEPAPKVPGARTSNQRVPVRLLVLLEKEGLLPASHCTFHSSSFASPSA